MNHSKLIKINQTPLFHMNHYKMSSEMVFMKRMFDLVVALLLFVLTLPLMMVVAMLIRISDGGPALYLQERVTVCGKIFKLVKFRTMVTTAEIETGAVLACENDTRITKIGAFLRKSRIDELPQLFNIIQGTMSLVGPRPERPEFTEKFDRTIPHYRQRHSVKAGLTGLAQVLGGYDTPTEDKLKFDLMYISNYSLMLDLYVLVKTMQVVVWRRGK